jgi:ABC-type siderophore export system fused ATPase/permease subunit
VPAPGWPHSSTHDDRYFDIADRIIKMDDARIESDQLLG